MRKAFIEVHDKITFLLFPYLVTHTIEKYKWFLVSLVQLRNSRTGK